MASTDHPPVQPLDAVASGEPDPGPSVEPPPLDARAAKDEILIEALAMGLFALK